MLLYAVVLAGGAGERFWPHSRQSCPKQFLNLLGDRSMLQQTVDRLEGLVSPRDTYVITGSRYVDLVREQLPGIPVENIIGEPCGRDTAAAVGLGALCVERRDPRGVMLVLPADHYVQDAARFRQSILTAHAAAAGGEHLVTLGITPTRPETGYGYIMLGERHSVDDICTVYRVKQFIEKPDMDKALLLLTQGGYLWNSGMFVWRVDLISRLIENMLPELGRGLQEIKKSYLGGGEPQKVIEKIYPGLPRISIDYGIMERSDDVLVIPCDFGWDDVGSWTALERHRDIDDMHNLIDARGVFLDTRDCIVSSSRTVATLGLDGLIIIDNGDSLLVCPKKRAQDIKKVVTALKEVGYADLT